MQADDRNTPARCEGRTIAAAFAGTEAGLCALEPAALRLRRALPTSKLLLLLPSPLRAPARLTRYFDERVDYPPHPDTASVSNVVERLECEAPECVIAFTESTWSPHLPAYIAYLAGIPLRAGIASEFTGGVLSHAIAPPPTAMRDAERHLFLLHALGFERRVEAIAESGALGLERERREIPGRSAVGGPP